MSKPVRNIIFLFFLIYLYACANQGFPPGGPVDKTPPDIVSSIPEPNSLNVSRITQVEFEFSEKLDSRTIQNSVFISPNPGDDLDIEVKGKKLKIKFHLKYLICISELEKR